MRFHGRCGRNVVLDDTRTKATRIDGFCDAITFSAEPVRLNERVTLATSRVRAWSGGLRLGVTALDPGHLELPLPRCSCPDLANADDCWLGALPDRAAAGPLQQRVSVVVTDTGALHLFVDDEFRGVHLSQLPVHRSLWMVVDLYGNVVATEIVRDGPVPNEVFLRGPEAVDAFREAGSESGVVPVFRTRLMLLGQNGAGKTALKEALTGRSFRLDEKESRTLGIVTTGWCEIDQHRPGSWLLTEDEPSSEDRQETSRQGQDLDGKDLDHPAVDQGYCRSIAVNVIRELRLRKRDSSTNSGPRSQATAGSLIPVYVGHGRTRPSRPQRDQVSKETLLKGLPEGALRLIEAMTSAKGQETTEDGEEMDEDSGNENVSNCPRPDDHALRAASVSLSIWEFSGDSAYDAVHEVFLSSRAIYLLVFHLGQDLHAPALVAVPGSNETQVEVEESDMSNLDYLVSWIRRISSHVARHDNDLPGDRDLQEHEDTGDGDHANSLHLGPCYPAILLVGSHRKSVHPDATTCNQMVEEKFAAIHERIRGQPFQRHVLDKFFAVENDDKDDEVWRLRHCIESLAVQEPYVGEEIPVRWLDMEEELDGLVERGVHYASWGQIQELALVRGVTTDSGLRAMLHFLHDVGSVVMFADDHEPTAVVVLDPPWLIDAFARVAGPWQEDKWPLDDHSWGHLQRGLLDEAFLRFVWQSVADHTTVLLRLLQHFDLICRARKTMAIDGEGEVANDENSEAGCYFMPSHVQLKQAPLDLLPPANTSVVFYLLFHHFLPETLFHRLVVRCLRWDAEVGNSGDGSGQQQGALLSHRAARFMVDGQHRVTLRANVARAHIQVLVTKLLPDQDPKPSSRVCIKVRGFLERTVEELRSRWSRRASFHAAVKCRCDRPCAGHGRRSCTEDNCLHFLPLDRCLTSEVVYCDRRRIDTESYRKRFASTPKEGQSQRHRRILPDKVVVKNAYNETVIADPVLYTAPNVQRSTLRAPSWLKGAAKLLNAGSQGNDWTALATMLGYKNVKIDDFEQDLNPSLALVADWLLTSGNNQLSVDMLVACLARIRRDDVVEVILNSQGDDDDSASPPPVFISYEWSSQAETLLLRGQLEAAGFGCWMDVGQLGGGDNLHDKIYDGIHRAHVVLACVTPRYVVSRFCTRELTLADALKKPIVPVLLLPTPWPPPGGAGLVLSGSLFVDFTGAGGHGGTGHHNDWKATFRELRLRLSQYVDVDEHLDTIHVNAKAEDEAVAVAKKSATPRASSVDDDDVDSLSPSLEDGDRRPSTGSRSPPTRRATSAPSSRPVRRGVVRRCVICALF